jgi:hypothetical protein
MKESDAWTAIKEKIASYIKFLTIEKQWLDIMLYESILFEIFVLCFLLSLSWLICRIQLGLIVHHIIKCEFS